MKHIVILGGGFAGITCALELAKAFGNGKGVRITVIDRDVYHWYHADFYEIATISEDAADISLLKDTVALSLPEILKSYGIEFIRGEIVDVDIEKNLVQVQDRHAIAFDYIVSALGSRACYYGIPGAAEHTLPIKSFSDALRIRNAVEFLVQRHRQDTSKRELRVTVLGGGFSGVELAAELVGMVDFLAWKYTYPREKIDVHIIEGASSLLPGLPSRVCKDALVRLREIGVRIQLGARIAEVSEDMITLSNGEKYSYDVAIWTAGVQSSPVPFKQLLPKDHSGRVFVSNTLQVDKYSSVFFIGDQACINKCPDPPTAMHAVHQAKYVAYALTRVMLNRKPRPYVSKQFAYIIPLGKKFAIYASTRLYASGYFGYLYKIFRTFLYYRSLVGLYKAVRLLSAKHVLYSRND